MNKEEISAGRTERKQRSGVFISHSHEDKLAVSNVLDVLTEKVSRMSSVEVDFFFQYFAPGEDAGAKVRMLAKKATRGGVKDKRKSSKTPRQLRVFCSFSHRDQRLRNELENYLSPLRRIAQISTWYDRQIIGPGPTFVDKIDRHLATSDIVLLCVSPDFLASNYCYRPEMRSAIDRHQAGFARVIPIILRPCEWHATPIGCLLALPKDGKPVVAWQRHDEALLDVSTGLYKAIEGLLSETATPRRIDVKHARQIG